MTDDATEPDRPVSETERPTMRDVDHTSPHETSADGVWERGPNADGEATPAPADD